MVKQMLESEKSALQEKLNDLNTENLKLEEEIHR